MSNRRGRIGVMLALAIALLCGQLAERVLASSEQLQYRKMVATQFSVDPATLADIVSRDVDTADGKLKIIEARTVPSLHGSKTCVRRLYTLAISANKAKSIRVVEYDDAFLVAVLADERVRRCESIATQNYFRVEKDVDLNQLSVLAAGVKRLNECAKGISSCNFRLSEDSWLLMDRIARSAEPIRIAHVEKLWIRDYVDWLGVDFGPKTPGSYIGARIKVDKTEITDVDLFTVVID